MYKLIFQEKFEIRKNGCSSLSSIKNVYLKKKLKVDFILVIHSGSTVSEILKPLWAFLSGTLEPNSRKQEFQLNDLEFLESTRVPDKTSKSFDPRLTRVPTILTFASAWFKLESSRVELGSNLFNFIWNSGQEG